MSRMDLLSVFGILVAIAAIIGGYQMEGGNPETLWEVTALIIVGGGTLGATMLQTPLPVFMRALRLLKWVFFPPRFQSAKFVESIVRWSNMVRREGLLGLEVFVEKERDPFVRKALQMLVDGNEPEAIRNVMEVDLISKENSDNEAARVFEGMGGYSPTIGIMGAVLGLIHVMNNLGDPSKLGVGIATAFVATIYGVGLANLVFLPIANKLLNVIMQETQVKELILDGIVAIAEGENPRNIESKLRGYFKHHSE